MPQLYLVRHGQPDFTGNYDSITALGARQASWLGAHFAALGLRFARIVSGTLARQVQTCDLVVSELESAPVAVRDARFNEYDHGSLLSFFEGPEQVQAMRRTGDRRGYFTAIRNALYAWSRHEGAIAGGERWIDFVSRIDAGIADACANLERDDRVLVVTSGGVIGCGVASALQAGPDVAIQLNLQTRNTGVSELIRSSSGVTRLVSFNGVPHLERAGRGDAITYS